MFVGTIIPARTIRTSGFASRACAMMASRFCFSASTGSPRRPSFAPRASTSTSMVCRLASHSNRRSPPADVSPLSPALTVRTVIPSESAFASMSAGNACSSPCGNPYPAVSESPR